MISEKSLQRDKIVTEIQDKSAENEDIMNEIMTLLAEETASQEARMKDVKEMNAEATAKLEKEREDMNALRKEVGEAFDSLVAMRERLDRMGL